MCYCKRDMWCLHAVEGGYDNNTVSTNYTQGGPGYNNQAGNRGSAAYATYSGSHDRNHTSFTI